MLKIRLTGEPHELQAALAILHQNFRVLESSDPYPNRGNSAYYRCYADVELLQPVEVKVEKPDAHQPKKLPKGMAKGQLGDSRSRRGAM